MGKRVLAWICTSSTECEGLREYGREYGLVSGTCSSVQFDAALIPAPCRLFQLVALRCEYTGETLNPKVESSNPSRPI